MILKSLTLIYSLYKYQYYTNCPLRSSPASAFFLHFPKNMYIAIYVYEMLL